MPFYFKPVVWNSNGYRGPSGERFTSGYPSENGFGHEEWNNSDQFTYVEGADRFRVFHTEGLGVQNLREQSGRIALMLIASSVGRQHLVTIAAGCVPLTLLEEDMDQRLALARRLRMNSRAMANQAWSVPTVRTAYEGSKAAFMETWNEDFHWIPNWVCPADLFLPLGSPVALSPEGLTGKRRLITMYGSYQTTDSTVFQRVLAAVPASEDQTILENLRSWAGSELDAVDDAARIESVSPTERAALIQARVGQGTFRAQLLALWDGRCAVTGCAISEILRASHILPWAGSTNAQRLDPRNGLPLAAHLDALFDRGLISFGDDGAMIISSVLREGENVWGLGDKLRQVPDEKTRDYLTRHRERVFLN